MRTTPVSRSRAIFARSSTDVPFEDTVTVAPLRIPRERASSARELDDGIGPLELQLRRALDGRPREEGAVGDEAEARCGR